MFLFSAVTAVSKDFLLGTETSVQCEGTAITGQASFVWKNAADKDLKDESGYTVDQGWHSSTSQTSILTIAATTISAATAVTFTCTMTLGADTETGNPVLTPFSKYIITCIYLLY